MRLSSCLLVLSAATGCGAPSVRRVQGDIARAVEASIAGGTERFDHSPWGTLLENGTRDGLVDYRFMQEHRSELDRYLKTVAGARLDRLAKGHLEALLINAYNAWTVRSVLEHPEVESIRKIPGVWTSSRHKVGGFDLTLDEIEHGILRPYFRDPRVHFVLNCASRSCAPLPPWAYDGDRIDAQLEERARAFLSDSRNVRVNGSKLLISKYFDWYGGDFTATGARGTAKSVAAYVARYAAPEVRGFIESRQGDPPLEYLEYDWSLNASARPDAGNAPH